MQALNRRAFLIGASSCGYLASTLSERSLAAERKLFTAIGITATIDRAPEMKAAGADYIVESVSDFLIPDQSDAAFERNRALAAEAVLPVLGCNSFLRDPSLRCVGPNADHARVLGFAQTAFRRFAAIGGEYIVFGSNTARHIPDGWPYGKAKVQFIDLLRGMGPLAAQHGITVAVESQRKAECNFINHIGEAAEVVAAVKHSNIRVLADLYHMAVMGDTPSELLRAMPWVSIVELAEKHARTLPGVAGDDFRPYFSALVKGGYSGRIDIEGSGTPAQLKRSFETVAQQAREATA